jgi:hypothetical protein
VLGCARVVCIEDAGWLIDEYSSLLRSLTFTSTYLTNSPPLIKAGWWKDDAIVAENAT